MPADGPTITDWIQAISAVVTGHCHRSRLSWSLIIDQERNFMPLSGLI